MDVRSADISNVILAQKLSELAEEGRIPLDTVPVIHQAAKDSATHAKKRADFIKAYNSDIYFYRGVLIILGIVITVTTIGGLTLSFYGKDIPQFIIAIGTTALGAVAGLLAPSPVQQKIN